MITKLCFDLVETYIEPLLNSTELSALVGINKITLSALDLISLTVVDVALFVKVTEPVAFIFPSIKLFTAKATSLSVPPK